jgi:glutathione S-transferase
MTITLYYSAASRAGRCRWLLEELEAPYELVHVDLAAEPSAELLRVHPHGQVPALVDGDVSLHEGGAICLYLADRFIDRGLAPAPLTPARAEYYKWMIYSVAPTDPPLYAVWRGQQALARGELVDQRDDHARVDRWCGVVTRHLEARPWFLGERFSVVDVMMGSGVLWARELGRLDGKTLLLEYARRLEDRPAYRRAFGS